MRTNFIFAAVAALGLLLVAATGASATMGYDSAQVNSLDYSLYTIKTTTRAEVPYDGNHSAGTIVVDTPNRVLFLVLKDKRAIQYGIGVGRDGFSFSGTYPVTRKAEWPGWTPPSEMRKRQPWLPAHMEGGPGNPLGARALYLGSTLYRIHGTNEAQTIGRAVSSGCIRMLNKDVIDLYERVRVGTRVVVIQ